MKKHFSSNKKGAKFYFSGKISSDSTVMVSVSIMQPEQSGQSFSNLVDLVLSNDSIKNGYLLITDSLQRHTFKMKCAISDKDAMEKSIEEGKKWENKNKESLKKLTENKSFKLIRWSEILEKHSEETSKICEKINKFYLENRDFKNDVKSIAGKAVKTVKEELTKKDSPTPKQLFENSKSYILEECAVRILLGSIYKCDYEIYKSQLSKAMRLSYSKFGIPIYMKEINLREVKNPYKKDEFFLEKTHNTLSFKKDKASLSNGNLLVITSYISVLKLENSSELQAKFWLGLIDYMNDFKKKHESEIMKNMTL